MRLAVTRDEISLPFDDHAESVVINFGQTYPEQIVELGLTPADFYSMKHRRVWQAMVTLCLEQPELIDPGAFYLQLADKLAQDRDPRSTFSSVDASADWMESACAPYARQKDIHHFVGQIKRCAEARNIIDAAQRITEGAYRVPAESFNVTDASVVLFRVAGSPIKSELGIDIPVL